MLISADAGPDQPAATGSDAPAGQIVIGLVNLMPPAARRHTAAQFAALLPPAAHGHAIELRPYTIEDVPALLRTSLDGLIVTGAEPRGAAIADEPCWPALASLADWAATNTVAVIWSCLAAHAAAFRLDGLRRERFSRKLSGVFTCEKTAAHPITAHLPAKFLVPHSRYNTLPEPVLRDHGYSILTSGPRTGADSFCKPHGSSLFLFLQGHPEYTPDRLPAEYLRDVRRYLAGNNATYPEIPENCFDDATAAGFAAFRATAEQTPHVHPPGTRIRPPAHPPHLWRDSARALYAGWLEDLAARKAMRG
jgi:homoserine O-succinyltransferase